ncbi:MAG: response regulator [Butyrivibrio sp.]|nr:response regulator [Butyrivibrio sp.]
MSNYSVMLVDDEEDVISAIRKKIKWEELGFEVVGYAHNGVEALELAEKTHPDVVMTDIKMPYMGGLELCENLKGLYPTIKIIIFSGFDEFEYAKEAIRLEAEEYILKPIDSDKLSEVFRRIKESLDQEIEAKRDIQKFQNYYMESLPILQRGFYGSLIEGRLPEYAIESQMKELRIRLDGPLYVAAIIHTSTKTPFENVSPVMMAVSVKRLAEEKIGSEWDTRFFGYHETTVVIANLNADDITKFTDECDRFCRTANRVLETVVTIGIGKAVDRLSDIKTSYEGAFDAISCRDLYGNGSAINITEISPVESITSISEEEDLLYKVHREVKFGTAQSVKDMADKYMTLTLSRRNTEEEYNIFVMDIISCIYKFAGKNQIDAWEILGDMGETYAKVRKMENWQFREWFINMCLDLQNAIRSDRTEASKKYTLSAISYVEQNYGDPKLSLDKICNSLGVSEAYFSTVFKKETGKSFINYLTDFRMEKALELLTKTEDKTYAVAEKVGYLDANYFSYIFKKQYGTTPAKYRTGLDHENKESD